jgi:tetratricopeptide (TPR) repeat protein
MRRGSLCLLLVLLLRGAALATPNPWPQPRQVPAGPPGPALEVSGNAGRPALPAVPRFAVAGWDGVHSPRELLVAGDRMRDRVVTVGGYITWIYDCATALGRAGATRAQIEREIDRDPSQCERPKFTVGQTPTTPFDHSLWVVDVPRPPFAVERAQLSADELARWPTVPRLVVGAYVEITGTFAIESSHHERNADGLVIYESIDTAKSAPPPAVAIALPTVALPALPPLPPPVVAEVPPTAGDSIRHGNAGARAFAGHQYDTAIAEYEAAIAAWSGNHLAWYGLAGARSLRGDYRAAADAAEHAIAAIPDQPMYWMLRGRMLYEAAIADAAAREARIQGRRADQVTVDRAALDFTPALQALLVAIRLENQLWRAHYYLGRILRDLGDAQGAAAELNEAIAQHAWEPAPYLALADLYRRWGYRDQALAIAELGATTLPGSADVWYGLGMVRLDRGDHALAIRAFTKALEVKPDLPLAWLQRGRAYLRSRDFARARRDLQAFVNAGGTGFDREQAEHLLVHLRR